MKVTLFRLWLIPAILAFVFAATASVFSQSKNRTLQWAEIPLSNRNMVGAPETMGDGSDQIQKQSISDHQGADSAYFCKTTR